MEQPLLHFVTGYRFNVVSENNHIYWQINSANDSG